VVGDARARAREINRDAGSVYQPRDTRAARYRRERAVSPFPLEADSDVLYLLQ